MEISKCYASGRLEAAKPLYERALKIIEETGDQRALAEAKANFGALVRRIEQIRPAGVSATKILNADAAANITAKEQCANYVLEVSRRINEVWLKEDASVLAPVVVQFLINAQGSVSKLELAPGCGAGSLEQFEAFGAVMKAAPFGPLPTPALPQLSVRITLKQDRGSIGLVFRVSKDNNVVITHVRPGSPAERSGLSAGDIILSVDGREIPAIPSLPSVSAMMVGKVGRPIALQIQRGNEVSSFSITRADPQKYSPKDFEQIGKANARSAEAPPTVRLSAGDREKAKQLEKQARALADSGELKKSILLFDQAMLLCPNDFAICCDRGLVYKELKRWDEAKADFERAQRLHPSNISVALELATCYAGVGQRDYALKMLWKLKEERASVDNSKVDGTLVELADPKAIASLAMLSNASPLQLVKARDYLNKSGSNIREVSNLERLIRDRRSSAEEESDLARHYVGESDFKNATECYERLYASDRMDPDYLYALIHCYSEVGNLERCHDCMDEFSKRFANDFRASTVREMAAYYKDDFKNTRDREKNEIARLDEANFEKRQMPLKVFIPDLLHQSMSWAKRPDPKIDYTKLVRDSLDEWKRATNNSISFELVNDINDAIIEVAWVGASSNMHHSFAAGTAGFTNIPGRGRIMKVDLLVVNEEHKINAEDFYHTSLHEFGHVLGLSHSSLPNDIMYFGGVTATSPKLTENDIKRVLELYPK